MLKRTFLLKVILVTCLHLVAQKRQLIPITHFSSLQNNSVANVRSIIKDRYGYVWIGSQDGLVRYDGKTSIAYSKNNINPRRSILNNDIDALLISPDLDYLWVLSSYGGLSKISLLTGDVVEKIRFVIPGKDEQNFIFHGIELADDFFYIASEDGYIFKVNLKKNTWSYTFLDIREYGENIQFFCRLDDRFLVFLNSGYLLAFDASFSRPLIKTKLATNVFWSHVRLSRNEMLLGTNNGVLKIIMTNDQLSSQPFGNPKFNTSRAFSLFADKENIWVGYENSLLRYTLSDETGTRYVASKGLDENKWFTTITYLYGIDGQIWVGNEYGIAIIMKTNPFLPFFQDINYPVKLNHCFSIYPESDSIINLATSDGYYRINYKEPGFEKMGGQSYVLSCFKGPGNEIMISGSKGTFIKTGKELVPLSFKYPLLKPLDKDAIIEPENFKDSLFFFASDIGNGVYIYDKKKSTLLNINIGTRPLSLQNNNISKLFIDTHERLWILSDNLISLYDIKTRAIKNYSVLNPETNEPLNIIKDICSVGNDYYLAVYGMGVFQLDERLAVKNSFSAKAGIQNVNLYKIYNVGDSLLITSSNNGLYAIDLKNKKVKGYFEDVGLHSNSFEQFSGAQYKGKLMLGGINGFTIIDPSQFTTNKDLPGIYISRVVVESKKNRIDSSNRELQKLVIPDDVLQTTLYFSAINWSNAERTSFAWRITERSGEWSNIGTQNFINLIGLEHGTYHFQVKAANEDGVWSEPKELVLEFLPKWYQTWWFKLLVFLMTAGIIYAFYRYRIRQIKKQHEIRRNIATDLHDDLGSTLNSVKVFTNLAIRGVNQEESLQQIKDNLTEATVGLRDMIWVLDDSLDTVEELVTRLKQFTLPVATASNTEASITAVSDVSKYILTKEEKRNLFLVCKEAINNSIKYAAASHIYVSIIPVGKKIKITIADNGKGFDAGQVKKGYGLKNMQYRAGQVKYKVTLSSAEGKGTQVEIAPT